MADCIPFATWTATVSEVSSLVLVWSVANAYMDRKTRGLVVGATSTSSLLGGLERYNLVTTATTSCRVDNGERYPTPFLANHSVFGIGRAGAEFPNEVSITLDPQSSGDFLQEKTRTSSTGSATSSTDSIGTLSTARTSTSNVILASTSHSLKQRIEGLIGVLKAFFHQSINILSKVGKYLLPLAWVVYSVTPQCTVPMAAKFAISTVVSLPIFKDLLAHKQTAIHHWIRDSGMFRVMMDTLFWIGLPPLATKYPSAMKDYFRLGEHRTRIQYGQESPKSQVVDMYMPAGSNEKIRGLIFFVYGGAWGSGSPPQYALVAKPFLERGMAVAVVGYRTYPEADALTQAADLELAASVLSQRYPQICLEESELGVCAVGHSSGSHILAMMLIQRLRQQTESSRWGFSLQHNNKNTNGVTMRIDSIVGISGPYDVEQHFQYEASKGLEQLSPMQPACGGRDQFRQHSPTLLLSHFLSQCTKEEMEALDKSFPRLALVHGSIDDVVPVESSQEAARVLRAAGVTKCDEFYLAETGHPDAVIEIMMGGPTQDAVVEWIEAGSKSVKDVPSSMEEIVSNTLPSF
ncbi:Probable isoprenylcysteine alpha-carbonyl methylesterase [Seminavis robusta]|uniref:Probable isoprenylcysteine alpha-carbonyl methylesterase n=1 Tax=Seminavis robusta TaxID=568900 RepID=A0A9N8EII2_9STRA|nr:Probable isoprenylcysteine alpha-carbonyl methylesterase [Seminavis robusta]|eukprot:Sro1010_g230860.1 Probable isoprenylcysteine alpha-carbonyl methylesterase (577) ;mRNA; f:15774-17623